MEGEGVWKEKYAIELLVSKQPPVDSSQWVPGGTSLKDNVLLLEHDKILKKHKWAWKGFTWGWSTSWGRKSFCCLLGLQTIVCPGSSSHWELTIFQVPIAICYWRCIMSDDEWCLHHSLFHDHHPLAVIPTLSKTKFSVEFQMATCYQETVL